MIDEPRSNEPWQSPISFPLPQEPAKRRAAIVTRVACYALFAVALLAPVVQFQHGTMKNLAKAESAAEASSDVKTHKGAIGRWRTAIHQFWDGRNIYRGWDGKGRRHSRGRAGRRADGPAPPEHAVYRHPDDAVCLPAGTDDGPGLQPDQDRLHPGCTVVDRPHPQRRQERAGLGAWPGVRRHGHTDHL